MVGRFAAAVGTLAVCACSPVHDWREVRLADGALVALFPCKPARLVRTVELAGAPVALELVSCSAGSTTWSVASGDVGNPARVGPALAALHDARVANLAGRETARSQVVPAGATPHMQSMRFTVQGQRPDGEPVTEVSLVFARDNRVFHAGALGAGTPREALETWTDSLRLVR